MRPDGSHQVRLAGTNDLCDYPAWSPDSRKIAFSPAYSDDIEIAVVNADGSGLQRLTTSTGDDIHPSWSANGTMITFQSYRTGNDDIFVMGADGSNQTCLTTDEAGSSDDSPDWFGTAVSGVTPKSGEWGTTITVRSISGNGFAPGATVALVKGSKTIPGRSVKRVSPQKITCRFRIPATAKTGKWNLTVTNPDGISGTRAKAFTVRA